MKIHILMAQTLLTVPALYHIEETEHKYEAATQASANPGFCRIYRIRLYSLYLEGFLRRVT
jgi:hypothetical protein